MSRWQHYDLEQKHAEAGALVFGGRAAIPAADHRFLYDGHYENDAPGFSIAIWPLGPEADGRLPVLFGGGDLYVELAGGENRWGKLAPYPLKELRREEAGWRDAEADYRQDLGGLEESGWHVVAGSSSAVAVFFGVQMKPGKVPKELPEGLEVVRGQVPGAKAHPRATVGVWLADAAAGTAAPFDPADPRVGAAKKALASVFGKKPEPGFVVLPTQELRTKPRGVGAQEPKATPAGERSSRRRSGRSSPRGACSSTGRSAAASTSSTSSTI